MLFMAVAGGASSAQAPRLNTIMRSKLEHSQNILEAVVTTARP
jgi:hypothetical protein